MGDPTRDQSGGNETAQSRVVRGATWRVYEWGGCRAAPLLDPETSYEARRARGR
jgi:hypothetical protein